MAKIISVALVLLLSASITLAEASAQTIDNVIDDIKTSQRTRSVGTLNCSLVSDAQFEALGETVMEAVHPGATDQIMESMMGGEGSESLQLMRIRMGMNYLGCGLRGSTTPFGYGMMGGISGSKLGKSNSYGMHSYYSSQGYDRTFGTLAVKALSWLIFVAISTWVVKAVWQHGERRKK